MRLERAGAAPPAGLRCAETPLPVVIDITDQNLGDRRRTRLSEPRLGIEHGGHQPLAKSLALALRHDRDGADHDQRHAARFLVEQADRIALDRADQHLFRINHGKTERVERFHPGANAVSGAGLALRPKCTVEQSLDQEEAAYLFEKYHLISAPVLDDQGRIVGMMTVDDILDIIQDENKEDILALAGVTEAGITDTAFETVKSRAPWLLVNLGTAILASIVIARFDYAIEQIVALAVLMPIVASMGGNAGTQALTVAVRALAERDLTPATAWRAVRREAVSAFIIGLIFAVAMALIAFLWFGDPQLAAVAFVAMIINHVFAGLAGILIPLGLKRAGADPAVSSSVFVTTVTDVVGFAAFLGFAALILL